jgi:hypothetical protein
MRTTITWVATIVGGIAGLVAVRYLVYSPRQIALWDQFRGRMRERDFQYVGEFLKTGTGTAALLGIVIGCIAAYYVRTRYVRV